MIFFREVPEGFKRLIFTITSFDGVQIFSNGILGEYIIRIFSQEMDRPLITIKKQIHNGKTIL